TILYTSGTTSFPKGAVISHRNSVPHGWHSGKVLQMTEADRVLHALPVTGTWGGLSVPLSTFAHGACLILMETFEAAVALHLIEREGVTIWNAVDAMVIPVLDHLDLARCKRGTLRTGGFASTGGGRDGLFEDILHTLGVPQAYQPYGMTELNALSLLHALDESDESRAQSGAWAPEGLEVRVVDAGTGHARGPRRRALVPRPPRHPRLLQQGRGDSQGLRGRRLVQDGRPGRARRRRTHALQGAATRGAPHQPLHGGARGDRGLHHDP